MMKRKTLLFSIILALLLGLLASSTVIAADNDAPDNAVGYVKKGKDIQWLIPGEGVDILPAGVTEKEYMAKYLMSPEEEAAIVHEVPPCPVIINGTPYEPEQINLFDGQRLGFTVGNDGRLYAFTTEDGMERFQREQGSLLFDKKASDDGILAASAYSMFYEDWNYSGDQQLAVLPGVYIPDLGHSDIGMNNMISSEIISSSASSCRLYDYTGYGGDYFERPGGTSISLLAVFGWNDRASSLKVYD